MKIQVIKDERQLNAAITELISMAFRDGVTARTLTPAQIINSLHAQGDFIAKILEQAESEVTTSRIVGLNGAPIRMDKPLPPAAAN